MTTALDQAERIAARAWERDELDLFWLLVAPWILTLGVAALWWRNVLKHVER